MKNWLLCIVMAMSGAGALAQAPTVRFHAHVGYSAGGDTLASGTYVSGNTYSIDAGKGVIMALGADVRVAEKVTLQATLGHHRDTTNASNGEIVFKRTPIELLGFYDIGENFRLGGGLRKAQNAEVTASGAAAGISAAGAYESTVGAVLEGQYFFNSLRYGASERKALWGVGVRLVNESFKQTNSTAGSKNGSHLALSFLFYY